MSSKTVENRMLSQAIRLLSQVDDLRSLSFPLGDGAIWQPPLDLIETETEIVAYVALPGVEISKVKISAEKGVLALRGHRHRPPEWYHAEILRLELPWGAFERSVRIPDGCTLTKRQAVRGYLMVHLKKPMPETAG